MAIICFIMFVEWLPKIPRKTLEGRWTAVASKAEDSKKTGEWYSHELHSPSKKLDSTNLILMSILLPIDKIIVQKYYI